jgi:general secretion pathway protein L
MSLALSSLDIRLPNLGAGFSLETLVLRWRRELASCLPGRLGEFLAPRDTHLTLVLGEDQAMLRQGLEDSGHRLSELDEGSRATLKALVAGRDAEPRSCIELPPNWIITRTLFLPGQARKNLRQVIRYEIDRLTPFHPDQVYYDYRLAEDLAKSGRISVELALCRREPIQGWLARMREAGAPVDRITWPEGWPSVNLLPEAERPKGAGRLLSLGTLLGFLTLILVAATLAGPLWQKTQILSDLNKELANVKGRAAEVNTLREAVESAHKGSVAVLERKSSQAAMIDLLRELTDRLPDGTWVENLEFQGNEVQVRGESIQAAALIGLLEQAPSISGVAFRSPVSQVPNTDRERFHIGFNYQRQGGDS